ncbi:TAXI family TRAP transporter solute-binding subunit [Chelativorans salis]|uniref:TAXI family TRAP transporter solute-binding subunit n=1 Tax=Chelativorans salis TaxID=2978478 RepID=A0ABT2LJB9_9HYPH|nr:TAXI family TRAP transporter solute-binding subunit [Chelativorans sp. EGI FJ00035]MCT7373783.1 TAXI family TRAP transporter solute-binding subunit [Chelativorans sp. EGI FJ00035]
MKPLLKKLLGSLVVVAAMAVPALGQSLVMGAGQQGSQNYGVNTALAAVLSESGLDINLESYGGSGSILPLLNSGEIDLWAGGAPDVTGAIVGAEYFGGTKMENVRIIARLFSTPIGIFVAADSPINSPEDIKGKTFGWGFTAQPSLKTDSGAILANLGLSIDDMQPVLVPSVSAGGDEYMAGNIEVGFFALRAGKMKEIDASVGGIRFLNLDPSDEAVARLKEVSPTSEIMQVGPEDNIVGVSEELNVYAFNQVLSVNADTPDDVVEKIILALYENPDKVRAARINQDFDPQNMADDVTGLPWHPAALEVYSRLGLR